MRRLLRRLEQRINVRDDKPVCPSCGKVFPNVWGAIEDDGRTIRCCMSCGAKLPDEVLQRMGPICVIVTPRAVNLPACL